jgi:hypothetical protein
MKTGKLIARIKEKEKVKTKPQQIAYALELLVKLHKQNKIDNVLLIGLK